MSRWAVALSLSLMAIALSWLALEVSRTGEMVAEGVRDALSDYQEVIITE